MKKKPFSEVTQKEIIELEEANTGVIRLYLEGSFYKAYERSAFAFCTRIKDYRVLRKESKTLGRDILYVGFPVLRAESFRPSSCDEFLFGISGPFQFKSQG